MPRKPRILATAHSTTSNTPRSQPEQSGAKTPELGQAGQQAPPKALTTGTLVEVTNRTIHGRFFLDPSPEVNDIVLGVLGRAQRRYGMRICSLVFMSNHFHLLLDVDNTLQLSRFMGYFGGNLAKELSRLTGWKDKIWARRFQAIVVSNEEKAQVARLAYILSHGWKEGLVKHPARWQGVHSIGALTQGHKLAGHWYDRSKEYAARRRGKTFDPLEHATPEEVVLSPLPCWGGKTVEEIQGAVKGLVGGLIAAGRPLRETHRARVPAKKRKTARKPGDFTFLRRSPRPKRSPAPAFHAHTKEAFDALRESYNSIVLAYRLAAERLRSGLEASFPAGTFPPALPYVDRSVLTAKLV